MLRRSSAAALAAAVVVTVAPIASAQITGIFSNIAGENNNTPIAGRVFAVGTGGDSAFDRPFFSPDGSKWIMLATAEDATDDKDFVLIGSGPTGAGAVAGYVEDDPLPFDPTINMGGVLRQTMGINNAGQYVFAGDTTLADTTKDDMIVRFNGTALEVAIQEGGASPVSGLSFGATNDTSHILADGTVRYRSVLAPTTGAPQMLGSGATALVTADVTTPGGQLVAPPQTINTLTAARFYSSGDGAHSIYHGALQAPTTSDTVIVYDGNVVIQEGANLPGGVLAGTNVGVVNADAGSQQISPNGLHWAARTAMADGTGATATDVVLYNGALKAKTGDPIAPGSTELWDDAPFTTTFFVNSVDNDGNMLVGGLTNSGDLTKDAVVMYYGANGSVLEVMREGAPVDLDANGLFDDDAFINTFGNDDMTLVNGQVYFVVTIENSLGTATGNAFLTVAIPEPASLGLLALAGLAARRRR